MAKAIKSLDYISKKLADSSKAKVRKKRPLIESIVYQVLLTASSASQADQAITRIEKSFTGWNEMRISRSFHILEEADLPDSLLVGIKEVKRVLQTVFNDFGVLGDHILEGQNEVSIRKYFNRVFKDDLLDTAGIVMMEGLSMPIIPVGNDGLRFFKRFGTADVKMTRRQLQRILSDNIPEKNIRQFYANMFKHCQSTCLAENPKCSKCSLKLKCKKKDVVEHD